MIPFAIYSSEVRRVIVRHRHFFLTAVLLFASVVSAYLLASCIGPPALEGAWITGEKNNALAGEQRLNFLNDGEPVILGVKIKNATEGDPATLKSTWTYVPRRSIVYETSERFTESGERFFRLNRIEGDSESGKYRIDIELNGQSVSVLYFVIGDSLPKPMTESEIKKAIVALKSEDQETFIEKLPILSDFKIAKSVYGLTQAPKELGEEFMPDTPVVYLTMLLTQAPDGTKIRVDWYFLGAGEEERLIIPAELETHGTRQLAFNMKPGTGDLPAGKYEARVYLNGSEFVRVPFKVIGQPAASSEE